MLEFGLFPLAMRSSFLHVTFSSLSKLQCVCQCVASSIVTGNTAPARAGGQQLGDRHTELCRTSLHPFPGISMTLSWEAALADAAVLGRAVSPACGAAFRAAMVRSAASENMAGRRRWQAVVLLLLFLLLPCELLSHQSCLPQAHQEGSVLKLFWWARTEVVRN